MEPLADGRQLRRRPGRDRRVSPGATPGCVRPLGTGFDGAYGLRLADPEAARAAAPGHSAAYQSLDVTVLQTLVLEKTLGIAPDRAADMAGAETAREYVTFIKDAADALARLDAGEVQLGFFMNPTGLDQMSEVAFGGERMPQKTTFFYPKLPTGLVFHDLSGASSHPTREEES